ncbi:16S rRNA (cytosine(1402)-N(4))-methyltransferase RsmH [Paracholeplasma manati]|uniref:Ribosomal RNA small subunit methyltransferase H n=1 Tax=Paracholeplasma manati TaxID=591373 RepID=A0ABT2Y7F8_9MOLU|nr:16S rRNA (cytosine(1402)-N(4))-methyltransferase RsmH [Paracholeplasma manati]MCV2231915.1 16S rRNA (cytosine(1402)-N(4))-methyltransferase RsmH [Paracholeplasma manati]MDG0889163.1 16S rRNA (cytosine(1402)-N(4))-methyltransferase RsmH [Paracholeplasma manati]
MEEQKPKRRKRYSGKYPKTFEEKYKEQQPDKYQDVIAHVMEKGNTPAGMHRSIMVDEILSFLNIQPGEVGLDCTLGFGGHSKHMLTVLNHTGHLHATDLDPIELPKTEQRLIDAGFTKDDFSLHNINFRDLDQIPVDGFDFVLADLGVSSMQIDDPTRGFTFKFDGPLDLRMNPHIGIPANIRLLELTADEIEGMLIENADEVYAKEIATEITKSTARGELIESTKDLHKVIQKALSKLPKSIQEEAIKKASQRTFQALRIDVNQEYEALYDLMEKLPLLLKPGGRVAILTFHSGEDRLVKKAFQYYQRQGVYSVVTGPDLPSLQEVHDNPRARSAKLRCAIKAK